MMPCRRFCPGIEDLRASSGASDYRIAPGVLGADGRTANVGGRNLADEYFGYHTQHNFRGMKVLPSGSAVSHINNEFSRFWNSPWSEPSSEVLQAEHSSHRLTVAGVRCQPVPKGS